MTKEQLMEIKSLIDTVRETNPALDQGLLGEASDKLDAAIDELE